MKRPNRKFYAHLVRGAAVAAVVAPAAILGGSYDAQATSYDQATGNVTNCSFPDDYLTETNGSGTEGTSNHQEHDINAWVVTMEVQQSGLGAFVEMNNNDPLGPGDVVRFRIDMTDTTFGLYSGIQIYTQTIGGVHLSISGAPQANPVIGTINGPAAPTGTTASAAGTGNFPTIDNEGGGADSMLVPTGPVYTATYTVNSAQPDYDFSWTPSISFPKVYAPSDAGWGGGTGSCTWPNNLQFAVLGDSDNDGVVDADDPAPTDACIPDPMAGPCDADGDGVTVGDGDTNDNDACVPDPTAGPCDADGDGVTVGDGDTNDNDACDPDPTAGPCDADGDGVTVGDGDTNDNDACVPDPTAGPCDADGDGVTVGDGDTNDNDACDPDPTAGPCDADGDGVTVGDGDTNDNDACVPSVMAGACDADANGDGIQDALADAADADTTFGTCSTFGPYVVGEATSYPLGDFKSTFDTTKDIQIGMFSAPTVLYSGPWPASDVATITPTLAGHHKFVVFGISPAGLHTYAGCLADSMTVEPTTTTAGGGGTTTTIGGGTTTTAASGATTTTAASGATTTTAATQVAGTTQAATAAVAAARTGANIAVLLAFASGLVLIGSALLFRRRKNTQ